MIILKEIIVTASFLPYISDCKISQVYDKISKAETLSVVHFIGGKMRRFISNFMIFTSHGHD